MLIITVLLYYVVLFSSATSKVPVSGSTTSCQNSSSTVGLLNSVHSKLTSVYSGGTGESSYASYRPPPPPLGYIVAYTPEQLTEIIKDQFTSGPPTSLYHCQSVVSNGADVCNEKSSVRTACNKPIIRRHASLVNWLIY